MFPGADSWGIATATALGVETRFEVHAFLMQHEVPFYTLEDLEHDRKALDQLGR
jgi:hypothetical protein